ncbi:MAG: cupredoxin domain-containing protein, partial [Anaerolineae bacterium]|nr:cupredoxin domain-containing protein [Anaerolineae bacterium]
GHMGGAGRGANAAAATVVDGGREITVAATEFGFEPMTIQVKVGEAINIVFLNQGVLEHDLTITDYGLYLFAQPGETIVGGLTAEGAGEYEIICSVPGHAEAGMRGLLVVTEL